MSKGKVYYNEFGMSKLKYERGGGLAVVCLRVGESETLLVGEFR